MSLESQIADLVTATTTLTESVNARMDQVVQLATAVEVIAKQISGSTINSTPIGQTTPAAIKATTLQTTGATTLGATTASSLDSAPIGQTTPAALGGTVLTMDGATQVRRMFATDGNNTSYAFVELTTSVIGMHVFSASDDTTTPNCCAYLITVILASKVNTAVALKTELRANDLRLVQHATTGKFYLSVKKGNINGPMIWQFQIYTNGKVASTSYPVTFAADLTGFNTLVTL